MRYAKEIREEFQDVLGEEAREEAVARRTSDARSGDAFVWGAAIADSSDWEGTWTSDDDRRA